MKIVFTGGGTAGHVIPNLAIIDELNKIASHAQIFYLGSQNGLERELAEKHGIEFYAIQTGKLRRYLDWQNAVDMVRVPIGVIQSIYRLAKIKPNVVFSKGGFVSVPVALAATFLRIPLVIHESDLSPGLATRLTARFAKKICLSFPTAHPSSKVQITGNPIRPLGDSAKGKAFLEFGNDLPIVLVAGGSTGATFLNELVAKSLFILAHKVNVVWLTGSGKLPKLSTPENVRVFEFLDKEYLDILAAADLVVSRAGANALFEIAAAGRPSVLIPLPLETSRGDQVENAHFFEQNGAAMVLPQEKAKPQDFAKLIIWLLSDSSRLAKISTAAKKLAPTDAAEKIAKIILSSAK